VFFLIAIAQAEQAQAVEREGHRHPAFVLRDRRAHRGGGMYRYYDGGKPRPPTRGVLERQELIPARHRRRARQMVRL